MTARLKAAPIPSSFAFRLTFVLMLASVVGCGDDPEAELDDLVDRVWMEDFTHEGAIAFLEAGGTHYDARYGHYKDVDQEHVIPLLKRLEAVTNVEAVAFIDEDLNWAWALIIRLPSETASHSEVQSLIEDADKTFPGIIETEWGHHTLRLSFVDETEG